MIRQVEEYHGAALARLLRADGSPAIKLRWHPRYRSAYVLEERIAVYMKYSTNRLSPWTFVFKREHQREIATLCDEFDETFVTLVCGSNGVACLSSAEYQAVLDSGLPESEWVRVARGPRQKYAVSGSVGRRVCRIGDNEYPAKMYAAIRRASGIKAAKG